MLAVVHPDGQYPASVFLSFRLIWRWKRLSLAAEQRADRLAEEDAWVAAREADEAYLAAQEEHAERWQGQAA
jgi:hypothetical protein